MCHLILFFYVASAAVGQAITSASSRPPARLLQPSSSQTNCDGVGTFSCATGTCYTGHDGFVGCCEVSSCAARTTCLPYTVGAIKDCDTNLQGCVLCSSNIPFCVTITNVVASQYIMYCDAKSQPEITYAYVNLVTTGSMALPPAATVSRLTPTAKSASTSVVASGTSSSTSETQESPFASSQPSRLSGGVIAGIAVGSLAMLVSVGAFVAICIKRRKTNQHHDDYGKPSHELRRVVDQSASISKLPLGIRLRENIPSSNDGGVVRTYANNDGEYLSPIEHDRLARTNEAQDAGHIHEIDSSPSPTNVLPKSATSEEERKDWWKPPNMPTPGPEKPSSRWSVNNAPSSYRAYQPNRPAPVVSELQSHGLHQVHQDDSTTAGEFELEQANMDNISPMVGPGLQSKSSASNQARPNTVFALTPLMTRWQSGRASTGIPPVPLINVSASASRAYLDPAARVTGPLQWPDTKHLQTCSDNKNSSDNDKTCSNKKSSAGDANVMGIRSSKATGHSVIGNQATSSPICANGRGAGFAYLTPEAAMSEGFSSAAAAGSGSGSVSHEVDREDA